MNQNENWSLLIQRGYQLILYLKYTMSSNTNISWPNPSSHRRSSSKGINDTMETPTSISRAVWSISGVTDGGSIPIHKQRASIQIKEILSNSQSAVTTGAK